MAKQRSRRAIILAAIVVLLILVLLIAVIVLASKKDKESSPGPQQQQVPRDPPSLLEVFDVEDGLDIRWFPDAKNRTDIAKALRDAVHILGIEVMNIGGLFYTSNNRKLTLADVIATLKSTKTGFEVKLDTSSESDTDAKQLIKQIRDGEFNNPVIVTLPVFSKDVDLESLLSDEEITKRIMVNFDLTTDCCDTTIGRGSVEYIDLLHSQMESATFVEVDVMNVLNSWKDIKWLLTKNDDLTLIISTKSSISNDALYDILTVRNDIEKDKVIYKFDETVYQNFRHLASTAGSPLHYFNIHPRDAGKIIWSHNTDTWEMLNKATQGEVMMVEGDIMLLGQDTHNQTDIPIMAHNVGDYNNITFEQWLDEIIKVNKGMKFDFKSLDAVRPALKITKKKRDKIKGPIWLNADILKSPSGKDTRIPADDFLEAIKEFPEATLSLGWTTVAKGTDYNLNYTMEMVQEMRKVCKTVKQPVTFPVRAEQLVDSWSQFDWLLEQSRSYTLTVWTAPTDNVTKSDMDYIKRQAEASRIYFDLPEQWRPSFP